MADKVLGIRDAARILNLSLEQVRRLCRAGTLRHGRLGTNYTFEADVLKEEKRKRKETKVQRKLPV